jgi:hypothetical protein
LALTCFLSFFFLFFFLKSFFFRNAVWNDLESKLVQRASDKVPLIRIQAALGLSRLQDVDECANSASQAFLRLLSSDPNKEVRRTALKNLVTNRHTLQAIIDRVRDVSPEVRAESFKVITSNMRMKTLSIGQRVFLVESGLRDRDPNVRKECVTMCLEWLKSQGSSIPALLKAFDVENAEESLVETLIETLLEHSTLDSIDWRKGTITSELAVLWRVFITWHMKKSSGSASASSSSPSSRSFSSASHQSEIVEANLPETLIEYCELVTSIATEMSSGYVLRQVLKLAPVMDKSDEGGRRAILGLLTEICSETMVDEEDIPALASAIASFSFGIQDFAQRLYDALIKSRTHLDLFERPESAAIIERHEARITELKHILGPVHFHKVIKELKRQESEDDSESSEDEPEIPALKHRKNTPTLANGEPIEEVMEELKELLIMRTNRRNVTEWSWIRTLNIAQNIFSHLSRQDLDPTNQNSLFHRFPTSTSASSEELEAQEPLKSLAEILLDLVPRYLGTGMSHGSETVRLAAIKAIGVLATADFKRNAVQNVELLYHALSNDELRIRCEALKVLFDLVLVAGFEAFSEDPNTIFSPNADTDFEELSTPFNFPEHSVFSVLYHHLHGDETVEDDSLQTTAVEGFTKLFAAKRLADPRTISKLLELLFDPFTTENTTLQQSLSLFMPMYAFASYQNQQIFADSFKSTLQRFLHASSDSSLAEAHLPTYLRFMLHLTDPNKLNDMHGKNMRPENAASLHNSLAMDVCYEMLTAPGSKHSKNLVKFFSYFEIDCKDLHTIRKLEMLLNRLHVAVKADKVVEKAVAATIATLKISDEIPSLNVEDEGSTMEKLAESTAEALSTLALNKSATLQKKAPPKSSKKLVSSKSRRIRFEDEDSEEKDSDLDLESDSSASSSDDDSDREVRKKKRVGKKTVAASAPKRSSSTASTSSRAAAPVAKSTNAIETVAAKKSVSRRLVLEDDEENDLEVLEEEEEETKQSANLDIKKQLAAHAPVEEESGDDEDIMFDSDNDSTSETEPLEAVESEEEVITEEAKPEPVKAAKRTARASSVSKVTSTASSTSSIKPKATATAKKATVTKKTSATSKASAAVVPAPLAVSPVPATNAKENDKNRARSTSASASVTQKPAATSAKVSSAKASGKATTATAKKSTTKLAEQSRLMKEMEAMLD